MRWAPLLLFGAAIALLCVSRSAIFGSNTIHSLMSPKRAAALLTAQGYMSPATSGPAQSKMPGERLAAIESQAKAIPRMLRDIRQQLEHLQAASRALPLAAASPPPAVESSKRVVMPQLHSSAAAASPLNAVENAAAAADASCNPTLHLGVGGGSLGWGMSFKVATAQECCDACRSHAQTCASHNATGKIYYERSWSGKTISERCPSSMSSNEDGTHPAKPCNVFVFCPTPLAQGGLCWSNDVWNHTYGEVRRSTPQHVYACLLRMPMHACMHDEVRRSTPWRAYARHMDYPAPSTCARAAIADAQLTR